MNVLRNIKQIFDYKQMGLLEFMFALFPIVSGYTLGPIPVHLWWLLIMDIIAYNRYGLKIKKIPKINSTTEPLLNFNLSPSLLLI